jgi:hypothetical protein
MCRCLACQRRTGAVISNQARFPREQVTFAGKETTWTRTAESGSAVTFRFCSICGSTVYWESQSFPAYIVVAIGNFADSNFLAPTIAVWRNRAIPRSCCRPTRRLSMWLSRANNTSLAWNAAANESVALI